MPLLIDCYNVLRANMPPMLAGLSEAGLCRALARTSWAAAGGSAGPGGTPITVVADGRPKPLGAAESPVPEVELVYSGPHRSADDLIIELIRQYSAPRRLTVVSSDRQIRAAARARRARDLPSDAFIDQLVDQLRRHAQGPSPPDRPSVGPLPPELVEQWKDYFGLTPDEASHPPKTVPPPSPDATSTVEVRFAVADDAPRVARLDRTIDLPTIRAAIDDLQVLVAVEGLHVIGVLRFEMLWRKVPLLSLIVVDNAHRGRGLSRRLLDRLLTQLRDAGHASLLSSSQKDETAPQNWHAHMGFVPNGRLDQLPGQTAPELFYRLAL